MNAPVLGECMLGKRKVWCRESGGLRAKDGAPHRATAPARRMQSPSPWKAVAAIGWGVRKWGISARIAAADTMPP